jgi:hypothetical protein
VRWRRPEGLLELDPDVGTEIARLGAIEGFGRSVLTGVVPLVALDALGSKRAVSYVFVGGAVITMLFTLNVGVLERRMQRHVAIYDSPAENEIASFANITPIVILSPLSAWWKVQSTDGSLTGWVLSTFVKESPKPEFLLNQQHDHS